MFNLESSENNSHSLSRINKPLALGEGVFKIGICMYALGFSESKKLRK